jgi:hypothetical protein
MAPVDTSMYNTGQNMNKDPMHEMLEAAQIRNAMGNLNKNVGGSPTPSVVDTIAAQPSTYGQPQ